MHEIINAVFKLNSLKEYENVEYYFIRISTISFNNNFILHSGSIRDFQKTEFLRLATSKLNLQLHFVFKIILNLIYLKATSFQQYFDRKYTKSTYI